METVSKHTCLILAALLHDYGIRRIVVSPGTRCAPVVSALHRSGNFEMTTVIDERSAAFIALGMAAASRKPVALVCTSGSAMLNYGPALAEAYYRNIPLIAITADRPAEWIDQLDGQTVRQNGALSAVTRRNVDIPVEDGSPKQLFYVNRLLNDALQAACAQPYGPVQINIQLAAPLIELREFPENVYAEKIEVFCPSYSPAPAVIRQILGPAQRASKLLIVLGGMCPDEALAETLKSIAEIHGAMILAEIQANIDSPNPASFEKRMRDLPVPDTVITAGGSIVSARLKAWLRALGKSTRFVSVGQYDNIVDTYLHSAVQARMSDNEFFSALNQTLPEYCLDKKWKSEFLSFRSEPTKDETALLLEAVLSHAGDFDVHFGNGMAIRYAQSSGFRTEGTVFCNRGVNGIDGSTSTAIGSAIVSERPTLLITGDMSAAYDIGALATRQIPASFRIAVINNGGGDIFRRIPTTGPLPERERFFSVRPRLPLAQLAEAYGFSYLEASSPSDEAIVRFFDEDSSPTILNLKITPYQYGK